VRCPTCQALNPESAEWCSQCYASLRPPEPVEVAPPEPAPAEVAPTAGAPDSQVADSQVDGSQVVGYVSDDGRFRRTEDGLDWRCEVCDSWNPIERTTCATCGEGFGRSIAEPAPDPAAAVDRSVALLTSAALPGWGHYLMGRKAQGIARGALFITWFVGGVLLLGSALRADQSITPALPLLLGAVLLWGLTMLDVVTVHTGRGRELLQPRTLLWLTVSVIGMTVLSFTAAALSVTSTG